MSKAQIDRQKVKKTVLALMAGAALLPIAAWSTMIVHDPVQTAEQLTSEARNIIQWTETQVSTLNTEINTAKSLLYQGNPGSLISQIPGMKDVGGLVNSAGQLANSVNQLRAVIDPRAYQSQFNGILASYGYQSWGGYTSPYGVSINPYQGGYQFATAEYTAAGRIQQMISQIEAQKASIQAEIAQDAQLANSAQTDAEVQKYHTAISALESALQELNGRESQLQTQYQLLMGQVTAAIAIYTQSQAERAAAAWQSTSENAMGAMGVNYSQPVTATEFGYVDNPAVGGTGDPGNGGAWYLGNHDNYIGGQNSVGIAVPKDVQVAQYGSTSAAFGKMVTLTNPANGMTTSAPIVDVSPSGKPLDMLYGTASSLGVQHNSKEPIQVSFQNVN